MLITLIFVIPGISHMATFLIQILELRFNSLTLPVILPIPGNSEGELTVSAGEELVIVEDDGGGWTLVARGTEEGYVPTTYVEKL